MIPITYILPIRSASVTGLNDLTQYLRSLDVAQLIVVDGSPANIFSAHSKHWNDFSLHVLPDPMRDTPNGKVRGVLTGLRYATCPKIVVADDDVRYQNAELARMASLLDAYDLVRPQNYFDPMPWHAILDTSRTLINRATGGDWPGTLGFRRRSLPDGYRGDVLFENLELTRTIVARGGRELIARDFYVRRLPPTEHHYWSQRVRQAYDEWARPSRLAALLLSGTVFTSALLTRRWLAAATVATATIVVAELGRRTAGGHKRFPVLSSLLAPVWLMERGLCSWAAIYLRLRGGVKYNGRRFPIAATSAHALKVKS